MQTLRILTFYSLILNRACRSADVVINMFISAVICLVKLQPYIDIQVKLIREKANYACAAPLWLISQVHSCFFQVFGASVLIGTGKKKQLAKAVITALRKARRRLLINRSSNPLGSPRLHKWLYKYNHLKRVCARCTSTAKCSRSFLISPLFFPRWNKARWKDEIIKCRVSVYLCKGGTLSTVLRLPRVDTTLKLSVQSHETWR